MNKEKDEMVYSQYEDDFLQCSDSIEEVVEAALSDYDESQVSEMKTITIYKGTKKLQEFEQFFDVNSLLETINENAYESCGEAADDYLMHVTKEAKEDLNNLILSWANKHKLQPSFFMVEDIKEVEYDLKDWDF